MFKKTVVGSLMVLLGACSMCKSYPAAEVRNKIPLTPPADTPCTPEVKHVEVAILPASESFCPGNMVEVNGDYCPTAQQRCISMMNNKGEATNEDIDPNGRCGEWAEPVTCAVAKVHKHYCIDKYELPNQAGAIPLDWLTWYDAKNACESVGKRLCTRSEWTFAAEGPYMHPYPYGDGYHRDRTVCNFDQHLAEQSATIKRSDGTLTHPTGDDVMNVTNVNSDVGQALHNMLIRSGTLTLCVSDWGVYDMPGNIDEWVVNETGIPYVSGLMGGHVFGVRNASRPMTDAHGPNFKWYETGGRCCSNR